MAVVPTPGQIALYVVAIAMGVMIHYSVLFCLAATSFWIVRSQGLIYGYYSLFNLGRYPGRHLSRPLQVRVQLDHSDHRRNERSHALVDPGGRRPGALILQLALATLIATSATRLFWLAALKRYASASS